MMSKRYCLVTLQDEELTPYWIVTIDWKDPDGRRVEAGMYYVAPREPKNPAKLVKAFKKVLGVDVRVQWQHCTGPELPTRLQEKDDE
jgi:hypothetical protein